MLAGIYGRGDIVESWIFKGDTCLKKRFFETCRFSEDLDFTLRRPDHLDKVSGGQYGGDGRDVVLLIVEAYSEKGAGFPDIAPSRVPALADNPCAKW